MRQKLTISQIKDLETQLGNRYTKAEVDAIVDAVETKWDGDLSQLNTLVVAEVSALKTRMLDAENRLDGLDNDVASLVAADSTESAARIAGDAANAAAISAEETRATAAEQAIAADLATEVSDRQAAITALEGTFSTAVDGLEAADAAEAAARAAADSALDTRVTALEATDGAYDSRMDAIEASVTAEETARASADTYLQGQIDGVANQLPTINSNINSEIANRVAGDAALQAQIDALESGTGADLTALTARVTTAEADIDSLEAGLAAEVARATGVEGDLANLNLQDNNGDPLSPANLVDAINMVNNTGSVAVAALEDALAQEVADRTAGDATNAAAIAAEETRALAAEAAIVASVEAVEADIETNYMKKSGIVQQSFTATAGQTVFSLTEPVASVFIAMVMVNGVQYLMGSDFTLAGSTLTFSFELAAGDEVQATYFNK